MTSSVVWVTGASGFTGKHMISCIRNEAPDVQIVGLVGGEKSLSAADKTIAVDLNGINELCRIAEENPPDKIIHLAAAMPPKTETEMFRVSVQGTYSLLSALKKAGCEGARILVVGSAAEYMPTSTGYYSETCPIGGLSPYGRSKSAQSLLALNAGHELGFDVTVARPFNLIGPGLSRNLVIGEICAQIAEGKNILKLGNIRSERDFIDIRDAVNAYWALLLSGRPGETYNVATGQSVSIKQVIDTAADIAHRELEVISEESRLKDNDIDRSCARVEKISEEIGWRARFSLIDSIKDMMGEAS